MKVARFDPNGGPIQFEVTCDPNRNGSYTIKLWSPDNNLLKEYPGTFVSIIDDSFDLDLPNISHDRRVLEGMVVVSIPAGVGPSEVRMTVMQDDVELEHDSESVPPNSPGKLVDLFVELRKK